MLVIHAVEPDMSGGGRKGGLCLLASEEINLQILSASAHHIDSIVNWNDVQWRCTGMYGWSEEQKKGKTWKLLTDLWTQSTLPWLCVGDFNEILYDHEKMGGRQRDHNKKEAFHEAVDKCSLLDLGYTGYNFTWTNRQKGENNIQERLDRAFGTENWTSLFPKATVEHLARRKSDHCPILVSLDRKKKNRGRKKSKIFRFESMWLQDESCMDTVDNCWKWSPTSPDPIQLSRKLQNCGTELTIWEQTHFGCVNKEVTKCQKQLKEANMLPLSDKKVRRVTELEQKLDSLLSKQEEMWHQRSRANWIRSGDRNTSFFHKVASGRKKRNNIKGIEGVNGEWYEEEEDIERVFRDSFSDLFSTGKELNMERALEAVDPKMTVEMQQILTKRFTEAEVIEALSQIHPTKAPGPDGMSAIFFHKFWSIVKSDVLSVVLGVLNGSLNPSSLNHTLITLIPKKKQPKRPSDFRPISLCNVVFKLITKTIANRLKLILPQLISRTQSAFVPGRLITDNALIAFELFHMQKRNTATTKGSFAFKLDMSKAYDRVEWPFLQAIMMTLGLDEVFVELIMRCVSSVSFSVLINGQPGTIFHPTRGLRQGDHLSPYLFIFCTEAFTALIQKSEYAGNLHGVKVCRGAPSVSHLLFADDSIIFGRANEKEIRKVSGILRDYEKASGQLINLSKSEISFSRGISSQHGETLAKMLGVNRVEKHAIYLGLPAGVGRSKKEIFASILSRVEKKLKNWKAKFLSAAGRIVLIKAVAQAIPTYTMGCFLLPQSVCQKINSLMMNFWWGQRGEEKRLSWCAWEKLCLNKRDGGMGFRDITSFNQAMLAKQGWRLIQNDSSLLAQILKARYFPNRSFRDAPIGYNPSYTWRSIVAGRELLKEGILWRIGNNSTINDWNEPWLPGCAGFRCSENWSSEAPDLTVGELMVEGGGAWDIDYIRNPFSENNAKCILSIPIRNCSGADIWSWFYSKDGQYNVKSGYAPGLTIKNRFTASSSTTNGFRDIWRWIWNIDLPEKIKVFLWKCAKNILPVKANLTKRGVNVDPICPRCGENEETVQHALRDCPWSSFLWQISPLRFGGKLLQHGTHMTEWFSEVLKIQCKDSKRLFGALLWTLWGARNKLIFDRKVLPQNQCTLLATRVILERDATAIQQTEAAAIIPDIWEPPDVDWLKINSDASLRSGCGTGVGAIIRDSRGEVLKVVSCLRLEEVNIAEAEALAVWEGVSMVKTWGCRKVVIEVDNAMVFNRLKKPRTEFTYLGSLITDILQDLSFFEEVSYSLVRRTANTAAHHLASFALSFASPSTYCGDMPAHIEHYSVSEDLSSFMI
ncbi:hypothetical protein OROMI_015096 [Orobanche minor]